jgi:hypothetical protein
MKLKWFVNLFVAFILLSIGGARAFASSGKENCAFKEIPKGAVVLHTHAANLYIYPDAGVVNIDDRYSGCQNIWLEDGHLLAQARYINGTIATYRGIEPGGGKSFFCRYKNGKVSAKPSTKDDCPPPDYFPINKNGLAK